MTGSNSFIFALSAVTAALLLIGMVDSEVYGYGLTVNPDTVALNGSATAELCAGTTSLTITGVELVDPSGTSHTSAVNVGTTLSAGDCATWNVPGDFSTALNAVGTWVLKINTDPENLHTSEFNVSLFVVPESILGIIAVTGTSLAALAGYITLRNRIGRQS